MSNYPVKFYTCRCSRRYLFVKPEHFPAVQPLADPGIEVAPLLPLELVCPCGVSLDLPPAEILDRERFELAGGVLLEAYNGRE